MTDLGTEVNQQQVVVSAARDELVAELQEGVGKVLVVGHNLLLVHLERGSVGLLQGDGQGGNSVVVGASLVAREDGEVDLLL